MPTLVAHQIAVKQLIEGSQRLAGVPTSHLAHQLGIKRHARHGSDLGQQAGVGLQASEAFVDQRVYAAVGR